MKWGTQISKQNKNRLYYAIGIIIFIYFCGGALSKMLGNFVNSIFSAFGFGNKDASANTNKVVGLKQSEPCMSPGYGGETYFQQTDEWKAWADQWCKNFANAIFWDAWPFMDMDSRIIGLIEQVGQGYDINGNPSAKDWFSVLVARYAELGSGDIMNDLANYLTADEFDDVVNTIKNFTG